ncbi:MAG: hypothetical protein HZY74_06545 [Brevundimonas sp.]|nr:MAG: hypothetical protein HZY74_06545 [Brevundimonas sp.]
MADGLSGYAVGAVIGVISSLGIVAWELIKQSRVRKDDPLQRRLAVHFETYLRSPQDEAAKTELSRLLKAELKERQVPRDEWNARLISATGLVDRNLAKQHFHELVSVGKALTLKDYD